MLPMQLLRVRTRKGQVIPLFCSDAEHLQLAKEIISEFAVAASRRQQKKDLYQRLEAIEARYDDYKLVRGFATLLERRCEFTGSVVDGFTDVQNKNQNGDSQPSNSINSRGEGSANTTSTSTSITTAAMTASADPATIRRALFEESSRTGFALTDFERESIIAAVASAKNLSTSYIKQVMWSDLEENMVLTKFDPIGHEELVGWYNLSLMQTLLFNCTKLEFSVFGGASWKQVLRSVKRLGLMYSLDERVSDYRHEATGNRKDNSHINREDLDNPEAQTELVCYVDGPVSLFKLTDRYGTSIAKLLPSIVSTERWSLDASTVRKTMSGKKIYEFKISSSQVPSLLRHPYHDHHLRNTNGNDSAGSSRSSATASSSSSSWPWSTYFDSSVEEKFANRFEQSANGWKLVREPDPIVVSGGKAFIPDFMFEKYGRRVYLEIVGFWTKEYLERKMQKIADIVSRKKIDMFIAINENLACSKVTSSFSFLLESFLSSIPKERVILYKNDSIPVKVLSDYLRRIDREMIERDLSNPDLKIKFDGTKDVISINEIAQERNISVESAVKVASRDNAQDYLNAGSHFISRSKAEQLADLLKEATRFSDANSILSKNSIPESCHAELVSMLGYDVIWRDMDPSNAVIVKRK